MKSDSFRQAAETKDFSAIDELFAEDVVFRSPVVFKPYEGREAVAMLLGAVAQVFEDFRYTDQVETGDAAALAFSARVGDRELDGIDFLHFDADGRVNRMEVYVRPMSGVNALAEAMQTEAGGGRRRPSGSSRPSRCAAGPAGHRADSRGRRFAARARPPPAEAGRRAGYAAGTDRFSGRRARHRRCRSRCRPTVPGGFRSSAQFG